MYELVIKILGEKDFRKNTTRYRNRRSKTKED